ncbi:MAG: LytTR family transcriptional regulator DNA-binding domain-containing protein [Lentihominibacter sp.]
MTGKLIVRKKDGIYALPVSRILYFEKAQRKICIHTQIESLGNIEAYSRFEDIMPFLDERFMFCHRSYIFNMDKIVMMREQTVYLENGEDIYLGRDSYGRAVKTFREYLENNADNGQVDRK